MKPRPKEPTRKSLWEDMTGCKCPKGPRGWVCTKRAIRCNARLERTRRDYEKHGFTWGPAR